MESSLLTIAKTTVVVGILALGPFFIYIDKQEKDCAAKGGVLLKAPFGNKCIKATVIK